MALFMSTFVNKVDRKGRVSVPAPFRNALSTSKFPGIVVYPSFKLRTIEGCSYERMEDMGARLETLEQFSDEYDSLSAIFADAQELSFDSEGRILLADELREAVGITEAAAFVGFGGTFQIWEPTAAETNKQASRERAKSKGITFPSHRAVASPGTSA